jgi:hypothetical protein
MQSELSSHIGMGGKCFCRVCKIKNPGGLVTEAASEEQRIHEFMQVWNHFPFAKTHI